MARILEVSRTVLRHQGFAGLLGMNFLLGLAYSFVVPFMSMWGTLAVGMSPRQFGIFMTITSVSAIVLSTILASWSDTKVPRRTMLLIGAAGGFLGYVGYAFLRDPLTLAIIGAIGLGVAGVNFSQLFAHAREELNSPGKVHPDAALLMSLLRVSFSLAWTVGPAIGAAVMVHFGYRGIFSAAAALFFLFFIGVVSFVPRRTHAPVAACVPKPTLRGALTKPVILAHFLGFVLLFAGFSMNMMNLPLLVTQQLGGTARDVGVIFGIAPFIEVPLMVWFGQLAARGHQVALLRFGVFVAVCYFLALTFVQAPWHIYPMQILSAASIAITTNVTITFFQDLLPGQAGVATSIYSSSFSGGGLVGYFTFGILMSVVGHRGIFVACAALSGTTLAIFLLYRHPRVTDRQAVAA